MLLADVARVSSGLTVRERLGVSSGGILAIQMADLSAGRGLDYPKMARILRPHPRYLVSRGDVLLRSRGNVTTAWAVPEDLAEPAVAILPLFIIRSSTSTAIYDPDFLAWWLNQPGAQTHLRRAAQGQSIQMVSKTALESVPLQLPPLAQQRLIAAAADLATREEQLMHRLAGCQHTLRQAQLIAAAALVGQNHTKAGSK